jgi:hypothetical protein
MTIGYRSPTELVNVYVSTETGEVQSAQATRTACVEDVWSA